MTAPSTTSLRELPADLDPNRLPRHVAVIMDGNGRWARKRGLPRIMGHRRGADTLKQLMRCCKDWGIEALTAYAFSTENWGRPLEEVDFLMALIERILRWELREMTEAGVRVRVVGNLEMLPQSLQEAIARSMEATRHNRTLQLVLATNYGGRQEILHACQAIATQVERGLLRPEEIDERLFANHLYVPELRDPDLLIRTSGEMRVSNFLLWQLAYSELYITDTLWPDFNRHWFREALRSYQARDRRYGRVDSSPAIASGEG